MPTESPYLAIAVFCEKVLQEGDGVVSAIRVVDRAEVVALANLKPEQLPPLRITMLISLKSGEFKGTGTLSLAAVSPTGDPMPGASLKLPVELKGGDHGANVILNIEIQIERDGTYWFDVAYNERPLTRMPLSVSLSQRMTETRPSEKSLDRQSPKH